MLDLRRLEGNHYTVVRPLLKKYEVWCSLLHHRKDSTFRTNKADYLPWEQIARTAPVIGFEIGNPPRTTWASRRPTCPKSRSRSRRLTLNAPHGIPAPTSFAYRGTRSIRPFRFSPSGFRFARRGGARSTPTMRARVRLRPGRDHPCCYRRLATPVRSGTLANLKRARRDQATSKRKIAILQFHGAPDIEHPWVTHPP